ncbi:hypothetical protein KZJ38_07095 [Paraburkholderia edwinii]|uniref:Uncharacterized protein n=1 Tax=Paraburkholderia edwinii TaxID=2861782 RepID=A0ABX8US71_9BURK|nr:hypothetical protein [Paraburkholderia edwinii]QYD70070.1 hypothetical protein KZJ38_07095 [Paraburkholderia edwinii]
MSTQTAARRPQVTHSIGRSLKRSSWSTAASAGTSDRAYRHASLAGWG